jgi:hypothetical protein
VIFWLVLKLEIRYRVLIFWLEGFWFLLEDFLKIRFSHDEIFDILLPLPLMKMARPQCDTSLVGVKEWVNLFGILPNMGKLKVLKFMLVC